MPHLAVFERARSHASTSRSARACPCISVHASTAREGPARRRTAHPSMSAELVCTTPTEEEPPTPWQARRSPRWRVAARAMAAKGLRPEVAQAQRGLGLPRINGGGLSAWSRTSGRRSSEGRRRSSTVRPATLRTRPSLRSSLPLPPHVRPPASSACSVLQKLRSLGPSTHLACACGMCIFMCSCVPPPSLVPLSLSGLVAVAELSEGALGHGLDLVARSVVSGGAALGRGLAQPLMDRSPSGQRSVDSSGV